ncbi:MAG: hypothetical protein U5K81_03330 [Trueperaceae bacterium]|nr:hypothetical protein [Trueperaceae bacterium]
MTRTEALHRLRGTWRFELRAGRVRVADLSLLRALDADLGEAHGEAATGDGRAATTSLAG